MQEIENENGEAALKYIEQLGLLTKEQQANKLAGINTIGETELSYANKRLLDELARIKATKMSEAEAAEARAAAYAKYNAAIVASGGLGLANFYSEKTQIELLTIAKLASLDNIAAAQATMDILNYNTQTDIIARIAAAQKLADDAKMAALKAYLAEAAKGVPGAGGGMSALTPAVPAPINVPKYGEFVPDYLKRGDNFQGGSYTPPANVTVNIEGMIDTDNFEGVFNQAMLNAIRKGLPQSVAGQIP